MHLEMIRPIASFLEASFSLAIDIPCWLSLGVHIIVGGDNFQAHYLVRGTFRFVELNCFQGGRILCHGLPHALWNVIRNVK